MTDFERLIHELLPEPAPASQLMSRLIDAHAREFPQFDWERFRGIDIDREIPFLARDWLPTVLANDPPADLPVAGLWFGLYQPTRRTNGRAETVADFYVAGARRFELDGNSDWAVGPEYFPEGRYANSGVLAAVHRAAYGSDDRAPGNDAEQYLCLGSVAFAVRTILANVDLGLILSSDAPVGVAVGWDSGDPLYIGFLTRDGFVVRDPREAVMGLERRRAEFDAWLRGAPKY